MAPEELIVFDAVAEAWLSGNLEGRRRREPGAAIGFGIDAVLLSEIVFPVITGALGQALGTSITSMRQRVRGRRRAAGEPEVAKTTGEVAASTEAGTAGRHGGAAFTAEQLRLVHQACQHDAAALGVPPAQARLLADAVVGALCVAPEGPRP
jgi:hypothetical protein